MEVIAQKLDDILATLQPLTVEWKDDTAERVIARLERLRAKKAYAAEDVKPLLDENFEDGILICRLFLGLSADAFRSMFQDARGILGHR